MRSFQQEAHLIPPHANYQIALYLDGVEIPNEQLTLSNTANTFGSSSKTVLVTTTGGALSIYNNSSEQSTFDFATLTVTKIA